MNFYSKIFKNKDENITYESIDEFLGNINIEGHELSETQKTYLNAPFTLTEIGESLKSTNNKSSPGMTGFSYSFYKVFWVDLKFIIFNCFNHSYKTGALPSTLSRGLITLIPKGDKPRDCLENWRPITLLNCLYKIYSKTIAQRINQVLPQIIHSDQCGFVTGRYIGECVRTTMDVLEWANRKEKVGLLLLIDFKRAFDSISFDFIIKTLDYFKFGDTIRNWVKILLNNFKACINHAGNIS